MAVRSAGSKEDKMSIMWKYIKPLVDINAVREYLQEQNVILPEALVKLIETNNGGRPSEPWFDTDSTADRVFKQLLSYNRDDLETIYDVYPGVFKNMRLYPIGSDSAGNYVCYDLESKEYVLYNHENLVKEKIITRFKKGDEDLI